MRALRGGAFGAVGVLVWLSMAGCVTGPATPSPPLVSPSATDSVQASSARPDFDGDGVADLAIGTGESEGRVVVRYGSGREWNLVRAGLDGGSSADFGQGLLARDLNRDGYTDLVIGDPDAASDHGRAIFILFGGADGLEEAGFHSYPAPMDSGAFGSRLALVEEPDPLLVVGAGDGSGKMGGAILIYPLGVDGLPTGEPERLLQGMAGVPDVAEPGDAFGSALAATGALLVVGVPREDVGQVVDAGAVALLTHRGGGRFTGEWITQDSLGVPDRSERDDRFGSVVAAGDGYILVGAPLEDLDEPNAGLVQPFRITASGLEPLAALDQRGLGGAAASGFGRSLAIARPCAHAAGVLIGVQSVGAEPGDGAAWLVALPGGDCAVSEFLMGERLGAAGGLANLGSPVSTLRTDEDQADTLVLAARGESEEGMLGGVAVLAPPYGGPASLVLEGIRVHEEREFALSSPAG